MARRCGGRVGARRYCVAPAYEPPMVPTFPSHHGWAAIHSTVS